MSTIEKFEPLYSGKAKTLFMTNDPQKLVIEFRDDTSAFDGERIEQLSRKGMVNNHFNAFIMRALSEAGIDNHFESLINDTESVVKHLHMIPIECVVRNRAAGSLCRRLGISQGKAFNPPVFEFFLKNDELKDPMINESHIQTFGWASDHEVEAMKKLSFQVNAVLLPMFANAGLDLVDYKLEFGRFQGRIILGDEFTPDGCRVWDQTSGKSLDKDRFRQELGDVVAGYEEVAARLGVAMPAAQV